MSEEEDWTDAEYDPTPPPERVRKARGYVSETVTAEEIEQHIKKYLSETDPAAPSKGRK